MARIALAEKSGLSGLSSLTLASRAERMRPVLPARSLKLSEQTKHIIGMQ
jgi:hypothetical protein